MRWAKLNTYTNAGGLNNFLSNLYACSSATVVGADDTVSRIVVLIVDVTGDKPRESAIGGDRWPLRPLDLGLDKSLKLFCSMRRGRREEALDYIRLSWHLSILLSSFGKTWNLKSALCCYEYLVLIFSEVSALHLFVKTEQKKNSVMWHMCRSWALRFDQR